MLIWFVLVLAATVLRIYGVSENPPGLSWDEVSIGYNAYSILKTGADEHGKILPLDTFVAYGDYKPPLSVYITVPFVYVFGLNALAVRLPSALFGIALVVLILPLVKQLYSDKSRAGYLGLIATGVMAFSPWHINLSRAGFEANIATTLVAFSVYAILRARTAISWRYVCWIPFVLAMYTFNSARYLVPLLGFVLLYPLRLEIVKAKKNWLVGMVLAVVILIPLIPHLLSPQARLRFTEVNIFSDSSVVITANERIAADGNSMFSSILNNRRIGYARSYLTHFFDHFEPWFLFIRGDGNPKFSIQDVGQLYIVEAPFLIIGLFWWILHAKNSGILLLTWLLLAIIPAATARETPHALRIENSLPVWQVFIAGGVFSVWMSVRQRIRRHIVILFCLGLWFGNIIFYVHNYYQHYPRQYSGEWQYGYKEALQNAFPLVSSYKHVVLSERIGRAYMYVLFYSQYDPRKFIADKESFFDAAGFYNVVGFDKYRFVKEAPAFEPDTLYILPPDQVPTGAHVLSTVRLLNGNPVLVLFD